MAGVSGAACGAPSVRSARPLPKEKSNIGWDAHTPRALGLLQWRANLASIPYSTLEPDTQTEMRRRELTCPRAFLPLRIVPGRSSGQRTHWIP